MYEFKYVETMVIDGREISNNEKTWEAEDRAEYEKFKDLWQYLEFSAEGYRTMDMYDEETGLAAFVLEYTMETDQSETIKFLRGVSVKEA